VGAGVGVGITWLTATPLLQYFFLPFFTHVNFSPLYVFVTPILEHGVPGFTEFADSGVRIEI
jgi:hypothetical protein